jgi:hypothetical protein
MEKFLIIRRITLGLEDFETLRGKRQEARDKILFGIFGLEDFEALGKDNS